MDNSFDNFYFFLFIIIVYWLGYLVGVFIGKYGAKDIHWSKNIHIVEKLESKIKLIELEIRILEEKKSKIDPYLL